GGASARCNSSQAQPNPHLKTRFRCDDASSGRRALKMKEELLPRPISPTKEPGLEHADGGMFSPYRIRDLELPNRIVVSPMGQFSCKDGMASDWHLVHLGRYALGGAGLVFVEQAAVQEVGLVTH